MRIIYVPLEPYESRYTLQLLEWNEREFKRLGINYLVISGYSANTHSILTGVVLDAHVRTKWALHQISQLVIMAERNEFVPGDVIFFEDMYHPGLDALGYVFDLQYGNLVSLSLKPKVVMR